MVRVGHRPWNETTTASVVTVVSSRANTSRRVTSIPTSIATATAPTAIRVVVRETASTAAKGTITISQNHESRRRCSSWKYVIGANASIGRWPRNPTSPFPLALRPMT